jgi:prolyl-tRNA synthetase
VAPYEVEVIPLDAKGVVWEAAERLGAQLVEAGLEVVVDDRKERAGVKFADADLMGYPYQVILGKRGVKNGIAEVKDRATGERIEVALDEVATWLADKIVPQRA